MEKLIERLRMAQIASCSCLTKTAVIEYHTEDCLYRILEEAARAIEQASQQQTDRAALADLVKTARKDLLAGRYIAAEAMLQVIESALSTPATEQASQSQWIPVSEQLPPEGEPVLIWMRPETVHDSIHNVIVSNPVFARKQAELGFVTHWMPLPAAPENAV